jgi:hypothetical protein
MSFRSRGNLCLVRLAVVLSAGILLPACAQSFRNPFRPLGPPAPEVLVTGAALEEIVAAVNQNADRLQSYQTNNASISVPGMPGIPLLRGNIAAERPGRIRLQASTALTGAEVDLGANDELFWFWVRRNEPPAVYFARHDHSPGSAAEQLMPIEPEWLLDALGFTRLEAGGIHEGPTAISDQAVEIRSVAHGRRGPVTKRTVIDARRAWVLEQHVYDAQGTLLASATARSHRYYPQAGISLPQKIDIRIPAADFALSIDVGAVTVNGALTNPEVWALPVMNGYPQIDLGAAPPTSAAAPMGRQLYGADWYGPGPPALPVGSGTGVGMGGIDGPRVGRLPEGGVASPALPAAVRSY